MSSPCGRIRSSNLFRTAMAWCCCYIFEQFNHQNHRRFCFGATFSLARRPPTIAEPFRPQSSLEASPSAPHSAVIFLSFLAGRLDGKTISSPRIRKRRTTTPQPTNPANCSGSLQRPRPTPSSASIRTAPLCSRWTKRENSRLCLSGRPVFPRGRNILGEMISTRSNQ